MQFVESSVVNPAYVFRPSQVARRARRPRMGETVVRLPWGDGLLVSLGGQTGDGLARMGVYELTSSEVLWRLTEPADVAIDVGANLGYFTSLLACRSQRVVAFEPHPELHGALRGNVARWRHENITLDPRAVSDHTGTATLSVPASFLFGQATATLNATDAPIDNLTVDTVKLDDILDEAVQVAKIDVEGHEPAVLDGATRVLSEKPFRDILFEEHHAQNSRVFERLRGHGYTLFGLAQTLLGVSLVDPLSPRAIPRWEAPNYLATLQPERAVALMRPRGWRCLRGSR